MFELSFCFLNPFIPSLNIFHVQKALKAKSLSKSKLDKLSKYSLNSSAASKSMSFTSHEWQWDIKPQWQKLCGLMSRCAIFTECKLSISFRQCVAPLLIAPRFRHLLWSCWEKGFAQQLHGKCRKLRKTLWSMGTALHMPKTLWQYGDAGSLSSKRHFSLYVVGPGPLTPWTLSPNRFDLENILAKKRQQCKWTTCC